MEEIETKQQLLNDLAQSRQRVEAFVASLTPQQLAERRDAAGWAVKDHLAHLAVWQDGVTAMLQRQPRYEAMGLALAFVQASDIDVINDAIFRQHNNTHVDEVLAKFADAHTRFMAVLAPLDDDALHRTYSHYQPNEPGDDNGAPILDWVVGNTSQHFMEHLPWMQAIAKQTE